MNQTQMARTDEEQFNEEVERMAEERAKIEEELADRQAELSHIGDFGTAHCTEFYRNDERGHSPQVVFVFTFPDGSTAKRFFDHTESPGRLRTFLDRHGAESITDMVGAEHGAIYTDSGWQLHDKQSPSSWQYLRYVEGSGGLITVYWPAVVAWILYEVVTFAGYSTFYENIGGGMMAMPPSAFITMILFILGLGGLFALPRIAMRTYD